jgi:hypothetical protein
MIYHIFLCIKPVTLTQHTKSPVQQLALYIYDLAVKAPK